VERRLLDDGRTADRQRSADYRYLGRRVRRARIPGRLESRQRRTFVAPLHHSRPRRKRKRNLAGRRRIPAWGRLDLVYWGTGNAGPWNPSERPGDNPYTASLLAFRPKTGEIVWYYQFTPNETYDFDATWEPILADIRVNGEERKVVMQLNRNGFL
jgi:hypothetical protein